jgi:hypothetical protein
MLEDQTRRGPGLSGITRGIGWRLTTGGRAGTGRAPGSVLIGVAAWLLALTGGGALFVSFTAQYTYLRSVRRQDAASVIEALLLDLGMIVFTLLAAGLVLVYGLRFALAAPETARGLRQRVLDAAPLPALRQAPAPETTGPSGTKKAVLLALYPPTRTTGTAARPAGSPPNWPPEPGCSREPPGPTCTPNWTAGHHDHRPARRPLTPRAR